jgi:hypothetical protein
MSNFANRVKEKVNKSAGSSFWKLFELTSSDILTTAADLTSAANGDLIVEQCILMTDATGLAGGTNFEISVSGETYGENKPLVEAVGNLSASVTRSLINTGPDSTNDRFLSVTGVPFVLQAGDKLQYGSSVAVCTGTGKILIAVKFVRVTDGADIKSAL